ncbi:alpha/beta hydrolase [Mycobacterium shimoidei]|uniref:alpha/beta hydrolase n=1 Tax=Mycobacterium shimoidei TaxID=29313 RepID=UPI000A528E56|nr:alpha/beta hydrolase-fold protein [Mycobacterium shimoidei]
MMSLMLELSRRALLRLGAGATLGATGVWALSGLLDPSESPATPTPIEPVAGGSAFPTRVSGSFISTARGGIETNWIIARPPGQTGMLRPVIALHGKDSDAAGVMGLGVEEGLAEVVRAGRAPFAVVSVDGGNSYWHRRANGEDSGAMVLDELLPLLSTMGLDTSRVGFMGWSMGGYGAMLLGARLGPQRTAGICAVSPALYTSYAGSAAGAFDSFDDWVQNSVFGLSALSSIPLRVDCGTGDRFYPATRQFVAQLQTPPAGGFPPGEHDVAFWRAQLPAELAWMTS